MRSIGAILAGSAAALALGGCHPAKLRDMPRHFGWTAPEHMRAVSRLDCPDREGRLDRTGAAADGQSCSYSGPGEEAVTLTLAALDGATPQSVLAPQEAQLRTMVPISTTGADSVSIHARSDDAHGDDQANIDLPGLHIHANGDKAQVQLPGVSINADGDNAHVNTGWGGMSNVVVDAHSGGAVIRAGQTDSRGTDMMLVFASDTPGPNGERAVGYIARGPALGPLVVATFRSKTRDHGDHDRFDDRSDVSRLVNLNVKG